MYICLHVILLYFIMMFFLSNLIVFLCLKDGVAGEGTRKKRRKTNESIKLGCPAKMTMKCIRVYPDYKTSSDSWRRKCDVSTLLHPCLKVTSLPVANLSPNSSFFK